ncbi:GntR family transcriptional regulator [Saxibacter everestensis]|uniref:GntR family transcriptional regulator n=1 Tax=Saxibacter everestensis TaxID=2909229 RepID=A0ABY8QQ58_9MICO|nr:GntR family transcriptional regulator [Brevibacteriaceae bacterium ZFBP1038]
MAELAGRATAYSAARAELATLRPVRQGNAFEETIERLLQSIKLGTFRVGDKLPPERELADRLRVSRATLREALSELQKAEYLEVRRGRYGGAYVAPLPKASAQEPRPVEPSELEDALAFRGIIEPAAAELAASMELSASSRRHLQTCLIEVGSSGEHQYRQLDSRLHLAIAEVTGVPSLVAAVADVRSRINDYLDRIPLIGANLGNSQEQHEEIVRAILVGDPAQAMEISRRHVDGTALLLRGFLA